MKYLNKSIYAFALVGMAGLWSCSQEDVLQGGDVTASGHPVPVTLTVNRGDAQTRTVLSENTATGGLNDVWEEGDKLAVYNSDGAKAGELVITDGVGEDTGVFTGVITSENGQYDFNLWYTDPVATGAKEADGKPLYFNSKNEMVVDLSKMPKYTTVEDLSAMDILSKKVKLNIKDNNATLVQDEKMVAHLAMARFSLNGIPAGETGKLTIKNNGASTDGILYKQRLSLASSSNEGTVARPEGIVINDVNPGEDIYLAFIPQTYTLSFTFESEKDTYTFSFENPTELEGGVYYSAFTKEEGAEEGEFNGVNIPLVGTPIAELHLHANFSGADPEEIVIYKKFENGEAYFDLSQSYDYYVGTNGQKLPARDGYTFIGWSEQENSTAWDCKAITISSPSHLSADVNAIWEKNADVDHSKNPLALWAESDLTRSGSGADAVGKFTGDYKTSGYYYQFGRNYGHQSYAAVNNNYDKIGVAKMNSAWTGGTFNTSLYGYVNGRTLSNVYNGSGQNQKAKWYSATTNLASYPEYFLVAGNSNLQNWSGETVFDTSIQHKHSWTERAEYYGYTKDICPEGYRLPTINDWKKILPKGGHTYTGSSFPTFSEIKEDGDIKYAVRWTRVTEGTQTQYLKIDALVVSSNVESASDVDWSNANVVTRYFKAAGMIRPYFFLAQFTNQGVTSYQWLEKATPQGTLYSTVTSIGAVQVTVTRDDSWLSGFYWVDDPNQYYMEFRFDANNLQQQGSFINVYQPEVPIACNIRCIKK